MLDSERLAGRIGDRVAVAGLVVNDDVALALARYVVLLGRWNRRMNLTALRDDDMGLDRLVVEPLVASRYLGAGTRSVLDIGSGGGSPAVPMKLMVPGAEWRLVESKMRKAAFLREVVRQLGLVGTVVEGCRYEDLLTAGRAELHEAADAITVRAVRMSGAALWSMQRLVRVGGSVFLFRGPVEADVPDDIRLPLRWAATYPLVESLQSRLVVLTKC